MNVILMVLGAAYLVTGASLFFWVQADDLRKRRLSATHLIGSTALTSGFTAILFFALWPIWAVAYWKVGKRDPSSTKSTLSDASSSHLPNA